MFLAEKRYFLKQCSLLSYGITCWEERERESKQLQFDD